MIVDLGDVVDAEATPGVALRTKVGGAYNSSGEWAGETLVEEPIVAAVFPASGRALQDLPEGERAEARYFLWSRSQVFLDDVVTYAGDAFRVMFIWPRPEGGYTRAALGRLKP